MVEDGWANIEYLSYLYDPESLSVADQTIERFKDRIARLYEQGADSVRTGKYVRQWILWLSSGTMLHRGTFENLKYTTPLTLYLN